MHTSLFLYLPKEKNKIKHEMICLSDVYVIIIGRKFLVFPSLDLRHQPPTNKLSTQKRNHSRLNNPYPLPRTHHPNNQWPKRTPALTYGTHQCERIGMHTSREEFSTGGDGCCVECGDGETDESGADGGGGEDGDEPGDAFEGDGEEDVEEDGEAFADVDAEGWEDDAAQGNTWNVY